MAFRKLLYHPESECYWEVFTEQDYNNDMKEPYTCDVTDIQNHEDTYSVEKEKTVIRNQEKMIRESRYGKFGEY